MNVVKYILLYLIRRKNIRMDTVISLKSLTKSYGNKKVVDNFNLEIKKGRIYGLIGPNGAGKTTIMKMIAGITLPTLGSITMFDGKESLESSRGGCSFMIEAPYIDKSFTARQNMEYMSKLRGVTDKNKIDDVLKLVGLAHTGNKIVKHFSLGMKQRLGIGMALLSDPEIMILDEPVNGLDPEGIVEIRMLLKKLMEDQGITILISSHLLAELSELCTDFAIIDKGVMVECLTREELENNCCRYIQIHTDDVDKLENVLSQKLKIADYKIMENEDVCIYENEDKLALISKTITDSGLTILKLHTVGESLEEYFLSKVTSSGEENTHNNSVLTKLFGRESK